MIVVDQGERKLVKLRLLNENDGVIPYNHLVDVRFKLMIGAAEFAQYSKSNEKVSQNGEYVQFEITQQNTIDYPPTNYQLLIEADVYDDRFTSMHTDKQWHPNFMQIRLTSLSDNFDSSVYEKDIKLSVITTLPPGATPEPPSSIPAIGSPISTISSVVIPYTKTDNTTGYQYQRLSDGVIVDNNDLLQISLQSLSVNYIDQIRIRSYNDEGEGEWSDYFEFGTLPYALDTATVETSLSEAEFTINNPDNLPVEVNHDNSGWIEIGQVSSYIRSGLTEAQSYQTALRFRNIAGAGQSLTLSYTAKQRPQAAPSITNVSYSPGIATININLISGITDVQYRLDAGSVQSAGLSSQFNLVPPNTEQNYNLEVRYTNQWGGGEWSDVEIINVPENIAPVVSNPIIAIPNRTSSSYTLSFTKATDNRPDSELTYYLYEAGDPNDSADIADLGSVDDIDLQNLVVQGVDVDTFEVTGLSNGYETAVNILVVDQAGNRAIYNVLENVSDPQTNALVISDPVLVVSDDPDHDKVISFSAPDYGDQTSELSYRLRAIDLDIYPDGDLSTVDNFTNAEGAFSVSFNNNVFPFNFNEGPGTYLINVGVLSPGPSLPYLGVYDQIIIEVLESFVAGVELTSPENFLLQGNTLQLASQVNGQNLSDDTVIYTVNNENIATVDQNGLLTYVSSGQIEVTATSNQDDSFSDTLTIELLSAGPESETAGFTTELAP